MMAKRQEQRRCALIVVRRMAHHQPAQRAGLLDQLPGSDHEPEPQAGKQCLGQAADIDHPVIIIERFKRRAGLIDVVGLKFVVVLNDDEVICRG